MLGAIGILCLPAFCAEKNESAPLYQLTIEPKSTKAVGYPYMGGYTVIGFRGTPFAPQARGTAIVENRRGSVFVRARLKNLEPATKYGPDSLTYVLWAVSPDGRFSNLGELLLDDGESRLDATTSMQTFGLIVTAEPYFAITTPSNVVVMENVLLKKTAGALNDVTTRREFYDREGTTLLVSPADLKPVKLDKKTPLDLYQARAAVKMAAASDADAYASEIYKRARMMLEQAEDMQGHKNERKAMLTLAREAAQEAEDARVLSLRRKEVSQKGPLSTN